MRRAIDRMLARGLPGWHRPFCLALALALGTGAIHAADGQAPERKAFRVCKDPNNMPFTNGKGEGFEDKLAELLAHELGLPVQYYSFPQQLGFIRNTLRYKLPGADYPCDVVMGVPAGYGQVLTTKPYYRSTYVLVLPAAKGLQDVKSADDFLKLPKERLAALKIGVFNHSPGSDWLEQHKLEDSAVYYRLMNADPEQRPGGVIERDLAQGAIDAAIVWGPIGGYIAKHASGTELRVIPLASEPGLQFDYAMSMGVRFGEKAWKQQIEALIDSKRSEIEALLRDYGVPLVSEPKATADGPGEGKLAAVSR